MTKVGDVLRHPLNGLTALSPPSPLTLLHGLAPQERNEKRAQKEKNSSYDSQIHISLPYPSLQLGGGFIPLLSLLLALVSSLQLVP